MLSSFCTIMRMIVLLRGILCPGTCSLGVLGGVYSFLHQSVHSLHAVGKKSALLHAQGKENRTKCVSTVPTTAFCLQ